MLSWAWKKFYNLGAWADAAFSGVWTGSSLSAYALKLITSQTDLYLDILS